MNAKALVTGSANSRVTRSSFLSQISTVGQYHWAQAEVTRRVLANGLVRVRLTVTLRRPNHSMPECRVVERSEVRDLAPAQADALFTTQVKRIESCRTTGQGTEMRFPV